MTTLGRRSQLATIQASQRATAKLLGVSDETVARDIGKRTTNVAPSPLDRPESLDVEIDDSTTVVSPAWFQSDVDPSSEAKRVGKTQERRLAAVEATLCELVIVVRELQVTIGRLAPTPKIARADYRMLALLLPELHRVFGGTGFLVRDVRAAVSRDLLCGKSEKGIGKLFARASGVWIRGLSVEVFGREGNAIVWHVSSGLSGFTNAFKAA